MSLGKLEKIILWIAGINAFVGVVLLFLGIKSYISEDVEGWGLVVVCFICIFTFFMDKEIENVKKKEE